MDAGSETGVCGGREGRRTIGCGKVCGVSAEGGKPAEGRRTIGVAEVRGVSAAGGAKAWEGRSELRKAGRPV